MNIEQLKALYHQGFAESHEGGLMAVYEGIKNVVETEFVEPSTNNSQVELNDKMVQLQNNYDNQSRLLMKLYAAAMAGCDKAQSSDLVRDVTDRIQELNELIVQVHHNYTAPSEPAPPVPEAIPTLTQTIAPSTEAVTSETIAPSDVGTVGQVLKEGE